MNFFKMTLLVENTISQWIKQNRNLVQDMILHVKQILPQNLQVDTIAKWCCYKKDISQASFLAKHYFVDNAKGVRDYVVANWQQLQSRFNDTNFSAENLENASETWHEQIANKAKSKPGAIGETIISFPDGWKWVKLEKGYCEKEAASMGHCGNVGATPDDRILSLRDPNNIPYLTFILNNETLGEMKGRANEKPAKRYHKYIISLLESEHVGHLIGGGYAPENNFSLDDLTPSEKEKLLKNKPELEDFVLFIKNTKNKEVAIKNINAKYNLNDNFQASDIDKENIYFKSKIIDFNLITRNSETELEKEINACTKLWLTFKSRSGEFSYEDEEIDAEPGKNRIETKFTQKLRKIKLPIDQSQARIFFYYWAETLKRMQYDYSPDEEESLDFLLDGFYAKENHNFVKYAAKLAKNRYDIENIINTMVKPILNLNINKDGFYMPIDNLASTKPSEIIDKIKEIPTVSQEYKIAIVDMYIHLLQYELENDGQEYVEKY